MKNELSFEIREQLDSDFAFVKIELDAVLGLHPVTISRVIGCCLRGDFGTSSNDKFPIFFNVLLSRGEMRSRRQLLWEYDVCDISEGIFQKFESVFFQYFQWDWAQTLSLEAAVFHESGFLGFGER